MGLGGDRTSEEVWLITYEVEVFSWHIHSYDGCSPDDLRSLWQIGPFVLERRSLDV